MGLKSFTLTVASKAVVVSAACRLVQLGPGLCLQRPPCASLSAEWVLFLEAPPPLSGPLRSHENSIDPPQLPGEQQHLSALSQPPLPGGRRGCRPRVGSFVAGDPPWLTPTAIIIPNTDLHRPASMRLSVFKLKGLPSSFEEMPKQLDRRIATERHEALALFHEVHLDPGYYSLVPQFKGQANVGYYVRVVAPHTSQLQMWRLQASESRSVSVTGALLASQVCCVVLRPD